MTAPEEDRDFRSDFLRLADGDAAVAKRWGIGSNHLELRRKWGFWADKRQLPPEGSWRIWLVMAGRGFGKTRAGAEWVRALAEENKDLRIALVAGTMAEARALMVDGKSGLLNISPPATRPRFEPSRGRLVWRSGSEAFLYSGENPEKLRGPEHHFAWCDELAKWACPQATWDNLMMGLRLGDDPRVLATTTPRPIPLLRTLLRRNDVRLVTGRTEENRLLTGSFVQSVKEIYGGTRLGRQELDGELIEEAEGALWSRELIERCRVRDVPQFTRVVVGVDPPAGAGSNSDACGIVIVGLGRDGCGYVIDDATVQGLSPEGWARTVVAAARRKGADRVIVEANNGGAMVESVLRAVESNLPVRRVHATRGKAVRAEPVAALYERGKAFHLGVWPELEDELAGLVTGGGYVGPGRSPDRADALVWAMSELMLRGWGEPSVRLL